ncbi:hypothetical protein DFH94DRAFT_638975, partial [Russula ochroleuca]
SISLRGRLSEVSGASAFRFGTRQVGSAARASFFGLQITQSIRVNNKRDSVPILPGDLLGFRDPCVEIHIKSGWHSVACPRG